MLAPLLFALFLKDTGDTLLKTGVGIEFNKTRIPVLFFADDMVLMTENQDHMDKLLRVLGSMISRKKLEINCDKSNVLVMKGYSEMNHKWRLFNHKHEEMGTLNETEFYKYLGITLSRGKRNVFGDHLTRMVTKSKQLGGVLRAKASGSWDKLTVGNELWNHIACPGILYGCEILKMDETTYNRLEVAQNTMGRWLLGARKFCSTEAIRNELGWKSMRSKVYTAKLKFWGKVMFQEDSRWTKLTVIDSLEKGWNSDWIEEIMKIRKEVGIESMFGCHSYASWCKKVDTAINAWENKTFSKSITGMKTLIWYNTPFNNKGRTIPYVDGSKAASLFFNLKAGSWVLKKNDKGYVTCKLCGENDSEIHRLFHCTGLRFVRRISGVENDLLKLKDCYNSEIEVLSAFTKGNAMDCRERGKQLLLIDKFIEDYENH